MLLEGMVQEKSRQLKMKSSDYRFTRRDVREHTGWTDFQVRTHLDRLVSMEYLLAHHGDRGHQYVYEMLYDGKGKEGTPFLAGLIDARKLGARCDYGASVEGVRATVEGASSPGRAPVEGASSGASARDNPKPAGELRTPAASLAENAHPAAARNGAYVAPQSVPLAARLPSGE